MNIIADIIHIATRHPRARHRDNELENLYKGQFDEHSHYRHEDRVKRQLRRERARRNNYY